MNWSEHAASPSSAANVRGETWAVNRELCSIPKRKAVMLSSLLGATPKKRRPSVIITVRGGIAVDARTNRPVRVVIEDWDDQDEQPLYFDLSPESLAREEETDLLERLAQSQA
jgi:hypothetical protein